MRIFRRVRVALLAAALASVAQPTSAATETPFRISANIEAGERDETGKSWFETWHEGMRFLFEAPQAERHDALWRILETAYAEGRAVSVTFDAGRAQFDPESEAFAYPICSVRMQDLVFEASSRCTRHSNIRETSAEGRLAVALAELGGGSSAVAIERATDALETDQLSLTLQKIALRTRANAYSDQGYDEDPGSPAADRNLFAALNDLRRLEKLSDSADLQLDIAYLLEELGDYDAAISTYRNALTRWPDEDFNVTLRLASLARREGDAERSLELINGLVERHGADLGMRFHYHRGWTLNRLGRFYEAIADFTEGMRSQPDYSWSYLRRACSHAMVGNIADAHDDVETALVLLRELPAATMSSAVRHDIVRASAIADELKSAMRAGTNDPLPAVCNGFWSGGDERRDKSPLLRGSA